MTSRGNWMIGIYRNGTITRGVIVDEVAAFGGGDDESHVVCCKDDNLGLCGKDLTHHAWDEDTEATCPVCVELDGELDDNGDCIGCPLEMRRERKRDG